MRPLPIVVLVLLSFALAACASDPAPSGTESAPSEGITASAAPNDGITLTTSTRERLTGKYVDPTHGITIAFDLAKVGDDVFASVTGNEGRPILRLETTADAYTILYTSGALKLTTTKDFIRQARQQAPDSVSTDGFVFDGDMHVLDAMLQMPEIAKLPELSRALGARGFTGSEFPPSLVLHKMARQAAGALDINLAPLEAKGNANGYCYAYPNTANACYGMCGSGCGCWSWVCGDCCYHHGCAVHDSWCREGKWWLCYDISAVIALFGC